MYKGKKQKFDWTFTLITGDIVAVALSLIIAAWLTLRLNQGHAQVPSVLTCVVYGLLILYVLRRMNLYSWISFTHQPPAFFRVAGVIIVCVIAFAGFRYVFGNQNSHPYVFWLLIHAATAFVMIVAARALIRLTLMDALHIVPVERIAFIGWSVRLGRVLRALVGEMGQFQQVLGFYHETDNPTLETSSENQYPPLARFDRLEKSLVEDNVSLLIVDESNITPEQLQKLGEICSRSIVNLKVIPSAFDIWSTKLNLRVVAGIPLLGVYDLRYDRLHNRIAKRAVDIAGGLAGLLVSAPIIAVLAYMIKKESPGPIFFKQTRLGIYGKPFKIIKLRSMRLDAEKQSGAMWAVKDDPRRLKIGAFMREWNLDELPQFWNVLKGEMSMVGPRPERPEFVVGFNETIRYYNLRHSCKPGVTGWAAVHGLRGNTSLEDRLEYDLFYIENWSLRLDFQIILMTLMPPKNAY